MNQSNPATIDTVNRPTAATVRIVAMREVVDPDPGSYGEPARLLSVPTPRVAHMAASGRTRREGGDEVGQNGHMT